eukprot:642143-Pyramimonas_sp.AAC.1
MRTVRRRRAERARGKGRGRRECVRRGAYWAEVEAGARPGLVRNAAERATREPLGVRGARGLEEASRGYGDLSRAHGWL